MRGGAMVGYIHSIAHPNQVWAMVARIQVHFVYI